MGRISAQLVDDIVEESGRRFVIFHTEKKMCYAGDGMWVQNPKSAKPMMHNAAQELAGAFNTKLKGPYCVVRERTDVAREG